jgi:hypothetical protein
MTNMEMLFTFSRKSAVYKKSLEKYCGSTGCKAFLTLNSVDFPPNEITFYSAAKYVNKVLDSVW